MERADESADVADASRGPRSRREAPGRVRERDFSVREVRFRARNRAIGAGPTKPDVDGMKKSEKGIRRGSPTPRRPRRRAGRRSRGGGGSATTSPEGWIQSPLSNAVMRGSGGYPRPVRSPAKASTQRCSRGYLQPRSRSSSASGSSPSSSSPRATTRAAAGDRSRFTARAGPAGRRLRVVHPAAASHATVLQKPLVVGGAMPGWGARARPTAVQFDEIVAPAPTATRWLRLGQRRSRAARGRALLRRVGPSGPFGRPPSVCLFRGLQHSCDEGHSGLHRPP